MKLNIIFAIPITLNSEGTPLEYHIIFLRKVDKRTREYKRNAKYIVHPWTLLKILSLDNITVKFYSLENDNIFRLIAKNGETAHKINNIIRGLYD